MSARAGFTVGLKWSLVAMLESPEFLYRSELGDDTGTLTPYERATELSFTYGGSTPSPELLAKAASGALATPDALESEARALLATPSGHDALRAFFREWTGYGRIIGNDRANVGNFTKDIALLLAEETKRSIDAIVLDGNGTVQDLLTSETTYMNSRLAAFYRYGAGTESFGPVARPVGRGIGLLAQPSIVSPALRLHFADLPRPLRVLETAVPKAADAAPGRAGRSRCDVCQHDARALRGTSRARHLRGVPPDLRAIRLRARALRRHRPLPRERERLRIHTYATVQLDPTTTIAFDGLEDSARKLAALPEVTDCVSGLLASYVFGGASGPTCLADEDCANLEQSRIGRDFYVSLARTPSFGARAP